MSASGPQSFLAYHDGQTEHLSDFRASLKANELFVPQRLPRDSGELATVEILASIERIIDRLAGAQA